MPEQELNRMMAELEELEAKAQPGPWQWSCDFRVGNAWHWNVHRAGHDESSVCLGLVSIANRDWSIGRYPTSEMQLLIAARNAVPVLIAEIRRLRAQQEV